MKGVKWEFYSPHHIYIHFPYCLYKCHYCDFNSFAYDQEKIPQENYLQALLTEIKRRKQIFEETGKGFFSKKTLIRTIFFGGGTPSLMPAKSIKKILETLSQEFAFTTEMEITLEANPGTLTRDFIQNFQKAGITRLSLGVQSLQEKYLSKFGRIHTVQEARDAIDQLIQSPLKSSVDLIYGFPAQTLKEWKKNLQEICRYDLDHLSCYALTAELGTRYAKELKSGVVKGPPSDLVAQMQGETYRLLEANGFPSYEISNFAKTSPCEHNLGYWRYHSYLGLGAGACSQFVLNLPENSVRCYRQTNTKTPESYFRLLKESQPFFQEELIEKNTAIKEYLMMGFRTNEGICHETFEKLFGENFPIFFHKTILNNVRLGRLVTNTLHTAPTQKGYLWNDQMLREFFDCGDSATPLKKTACV